MLALPLRIRPPLPAVRAFSAGPVLARQPPRRRPPPPSRAPPAGAYPSRGGGPRRAGPGAGAGPSSVSPAALVSRLEHHLHTAWREQSRELRQLADDLGVNPRRLVSLATQWAEAAAVALPLQDRAAMRRGRVKGKGALSPAEAGAAWDFDALQTAFVNDGAEALWNASLATFLAWVRNSVPLPPPSAATPVADPTLYKLHELAEVADRRFAYEIFPATRQHRRRLILHVGPTNSGKTHSALVALARARTGAYAGPLRLLAHEVFARFNEGKIGDEGARPCNLVTGEEQRIVDLDAGLQSCTVEMFPLSKHLDVGVVDEIQMIGDPQRGNAWTAAVVGAYCDELHLCGEESVVDLVQRIAAEVGDECIVKRYQRLSPLVVADHSLDGDLSRIRRGDCLVTFSRSNIFAFKRAIEEKTGLRVAVAYGGLPPEVREEQARAFNEGTYDVLVASDAIGMGLNLKIRRVVFESLHKFDGTQEVRLPVPQIKQIAGRAGRYGVHTPVSPSAPDLDLDPAASPAAAVPGEATTLDEVDLPLLHEAMAQPTVQVTQASIGASFDAFKALYHLLPASTPLSRIFALSRAITRTKPHYRATGSASFGEVGDAIAHVHPLTFQERFTFSSAPVNLRDARVVSALVGFVESYARGEPIRMEQWGADAGVFDALERVRDAQAAAVAAAAAGSDAAAAAPTRRQAAVFTPTMLQALESFHRCLTLYLWLSYRLSPIFCDQPAARALRRDVEKAMEVALAGTRFEKLERGKGAKRNKARAARGDDGGDALFDGFGRFKASGAANATL
ncbi:RNA helicase [Rhodotorula kratochvilovae]